MKNVHKTAQLGEVVAAAFDEAEQYSSDPREVSRLATKAVMDLLRRARKTAPPLQRRPHKARRTPSQGGVAQ